MNANRHTFGRWHLVRGVVAFATCVVCAHAQPIALDDQELAAVSGQGLLDISNTNANGFQFSTFTLNADITLNATLKNSVLGQYNYTLNTTSGAQINSGADINMPLLQFGSGGTGALISDPYLQMVYQNVGTAASPNEQVVGMRLGFGGISGNVGLLLNTVSGSLYINGGSAGVVDSSTDTLNDGKRWTGCTAGTANCLPFSQLAGVTAGDASGPSRDFWISVLNQAVQFPNTPGMATAPAQAQAGVWLNWTDKLTAILNSSTTSSSGQSSAALAQALSNLTSATVPATTTSAPSTMLRSMR